MKTFAIRPWGQHIRLRRSSPALSSIEVAVASLNKGEFENALRNLDRAWRIAPESASDIGGVYGRLLLEHAKMPGAAISVLSKALENAPNKTTTATLIQAWAASGQVNSAIALLGDALDQYRVVKGDALAAVATSLVSITQQAGWIAHARPSRVIGWIPSYRHGERITLRDRDRKLLLPVALQNDGHFETELPEKIRRRATLAYCGSAPLIGSGFNIDLEFGLDGRAWATNNMLSGWFFLRWDPEQALPLQVTNSKGRTQLIGTQQLNPGSGSRHHFRAPLSRQLAASESLSVAVKLPDGSWQDLNDSPVVIKPDLSAPPSRKKLPRSSGVTASRTQRKVDVIIPVFLGKKETLACIRSVLRSQRPDGEIILVDDASPDPELSNAIDELARASQLIVLRNSKNIGFAASVNRALTKHRSRDVVILNSDTLVHGNWISRLRDAAYQEKKIGSATPFTHDGSIASYPPNHQSALSSNEVAVLDRIARVANQGKIVPIPVGVGFCMYWRRDCLDEVGELDAALFGAGYGEETDLCLRASKAGWKNVLAADVFVGHSGGRSFGIRRQALLERSERLLRIRHPDFPAQVRSFQKENPLREAHRQLFLEQLLKPGKKFVLLVAHARLGGVETHLRHRRDALAKSGLSTIILRPATSKPSNRRLTVESDALSAGKAEFDFATELDDFRTFLSKLPIEHSEIHHFIDLGPDVIEAVRQLSAPYDIYVHDYVWICPQVTLIDQSGKYCREPAIKACEVCVKVTRPNLSERITVTNLRTRSRTWLADARKVFVPSEDVKNRLGRYFPGTQTVVRPLEAELPQGMSGGPQNKLGQRVRVALIGAIGDHKGFQVLLSCAKDAARRSLPLEFTVIGHTADDDQLIETGRVFITGPYAAVELPFLLKRENPNSILLPSVWPETWSFTLSEAFQSRLPIVAFDIGTIAERIRKTGHGTLVPPSIKPSQLNDELVNLACGQPVAAAVS